MPHIAQPVLRTCRREEFSLFRLSFSFLQGERHQPLYFQENIYAHTLSRRSTTHTLAAVDPALALHTGDLAEAPAQCPRGTGLEPLCCVCGDMWGTLSPPYSCESLDCVEGGDV